MCVWFYMGACVGWRAVEAQARGEDESAIEHHQIKCYLILTEPARKTARKVHFLSTERENSPGCCRDAEHREAKKMDSSATLNGMAEGSGHVLSSNEMILEAICCMQC